MIRNIVAMLLLIGGCTAQTADDPKLIEGYGKTKWGMTPDEVVVSEAPRAEKLKKPEKYADNTVALVKIHDLQIGATEVTASFFFGESGQKLEQVVLAGIAMHSDIANAISFTAIEKLLTEKYGPPTFREAGKTAFWKLPKTSIDLTHSHIPGLVSLLTITYSPPTSADNTGKNL